ncbi:hypothetical protein [Thermogemmatispora carboxidivorans]|uniref:hypothetical protein n=1 Tax=Thermogemmatispora carboxidivorans TaxID=1382306 RepID=UPI0012DD0612|nr:hypothetical protein [Thermogemmatispora carboxidivorans]
MQEPQRGQGPGQVPPVQPAMFTGGSMQAGSRGQSGTILRSSLLMAIAFFCILLIFNACAISPVAGPLNQTTALIARNLTQSSQAAVTLEGILYSLIFSVPTDLLAACVYLGAGIFMGRRGHTMSVIMLTAGLATLWFILLDALLSLIFAVIGLMMAESISLNAIGELLGSSYFLAFYFGFLGFDLLMVLIFGLGFSAFGGLLGRPRRPAPLAPYGGLGPYPTQAPYPAPPGAMPPPGWRPGAGWPVPSAGPGQPQPPYPAPEPGRAASAGPGQPQPPYPAPEPGRAASAGPGQPQPPYPAPEPGRAASAGPGQPQPPSPGPEPGRAASAEPGQPQEPAQGQEPPISPSPSSSEA